MAFVPLLILGKWAHYERVSSTVYLLVCVHSCIVRLWKNMHANMHTQHIPFAHTYLNKVLHIHVLAHVHIYL